MFRRRARQRYGGRRAAGSTVGHTGERRALSEIELQYSTGDVAIDRVLCGFIGACEAAFPGRIRCFVVAGGYAEGTATPLSDIDAGPIFRSDTPPVPDEPRRANALFRAC